MTKLKLLLLLATFISGCLVQAQSHVNVRDFTEVDRHARTVRYERDLYKLTKELTDPYTEQLLQVRSLFIWITANITYDYAFVNKGKELKTPDCQTTANCAQRLRDWENDYLKKVLKNKKGICSSYALLFKKMCDIAGISCEIISGYTKTKPYQVGITGPVNHAWNAVKLDGTYYLLDPTWASGYCIEDEETGKLLAFKMKYNDYYWFTPFEDLARNHYPKEGKWVVAANYTKEKFANNPYYAGEILGDLKLIAPTTGVIAARKGDTVHFEFTYKGNIPLLQVNTNIFRNPTVWKWEPETKRKKTLVMDTLALKKQQYVAFEKSGDRYSFDYVVPDNSLYYIEILFDYQMVMRFKIKTPGTTM